MRSVRRSEESTFRTAPPAGAVWKFDRARLDPALDATILIPTYNRAGSLQTLLESICELDHPRECFEVIVVDNNSTDATPEVVERFKDRLPNLTRVVEKKLSFTAARHTGASAARSGVLAYIDDDVILDPGWLTATLAVLTEETNVGIVAGRIEPRFEFPPPHWALTAQQVFNGWSLWRPSETRRETIGACGPSLAVRADVLEVVGGFPPDTIGVEAAGKSNTVEKIYVGPGDWGLNIAVRNAGYSIVYDPAVLVHHVIPQVRMTTEWWFSRLIGEGYMRAITYQRWKDDGRMGAFKRTMGGAVRCVGSLLKMALRGRDRRSAYRFDLARNWTEAKVSFALFRHPAIVEPLWEAGITGVQPSNIDGLVELLP